MKLEMELVPEGCWYQNLRSFLPPKLWDVVRKDAYARAGGRCMVCGKAGRLEAHERWSYDMETHVQKLETVIAVCRDCHAVIHYARTCLCGDGERAKAHFCRVNGCTPLEFTEAWKKANELCAERNRIDDWQTDVGWLKRFAK